MAETRTVKLSSLTTELEEAELLDWLVEVGDDVREGDPLAEVTTDKVDMELESPYDGTITELLVEVGTVVEVGAGVLVMELTGDGGFDLGLDDSSDDEQDGDDDPSSDDEPSANDEQPDEAPQQDAAEPGDGERVPAPPGVRRRAEELGVDLGTVERTGSRGQATLDDVERAAGAADDGPEPEEASPGTVEPGTADASSDDGGPGEGSDPPRRRRAGDDGRRAATRRATARSTTRSQAIPQFTLFRTADLTERDERRGEVSWTTVVVRSLAAALWRHPEMNATWDDDAEQPVARDTVRIGVAVDTPNGLLLPVMDDPDATSPEEADATVRDIARRARDGELGLEDMQAASSTVSNLGGFGVQRFTALLAPPQASILSVGTVERRPVATDGGVEVRLCVDLGLTVDHRVADGADGARFLDTIVELLEER